MEQLRVTHLSRHREGWTADLGDDGWFIRFTGNDDSFNAMRDELKGYSRSWARWTPAYHWRDGKLGAWWLDDAVLEEQSGAFVNLDEAMDALREGEALQWIAKRRAARQPRQHTSTGPRIPPYLVYDYLQLGVGAGATMKEIKDAYRQLAKVFHPDTGGSHDGFIRLQKSYERVMQWIELAERSAV